MATGNFEGWSGNTASDTTVRTTSTYNFSVDRTASWCPNCGRRRNPDGRCPDCDPWWMSATARYAGAAGLLVGLVLLGVITLTQSGTGGGIVRSRTGDFGSAPTLVASSWPVGGGGMGYSYTYVPLSSYRTPTFAPTVSPVNLAATVGPSAEEMEWRAIQELRQWTAYTDAVVEERRRARFYEGRVADAGPMGQRYRLAPIASEF
ncbi:MAG: hypothetical protein SFU56_19115 [Capsulimonadales bacterium]|nr:hypothetical protein [Capsulimonadales bacterium]